MIMQRQERDLRTLIILAEMKARNHDGHLTIMRFTTGWKAMLGTPDLDTSKGREQISTLKGYESLEDALFYLIVEGKQ